MKPKYNFVDSNAIEWQQTETIGVEIKRLASANDQVMELYRCAPNTVFPDHVHVGPEFVYILEGSAQVDGNWITAGWSSGAETGTIDKAFMSGDDGCVFLSVYTLGSEYV
ncbi:MAG: cupin domain-containing protein [Pseudomonadota bacterium]